MSLNQQILDVTLLNERHKRTLKTQDNLVERIQNFGIRDSMDDFKDILEYIMNDTLHSEDKPEYKHLACIIEQLKDHNIQCISSLQGYQPECIDFQTSEIDSKIGFKYLNLVHWILIGKRMDILTGIVDKFFKKQVNELDVDFEIIQENLESCLYGDEESSYKTVLYDRVTLNVQNLALAVVIIMESKDQLIYILENCGRMFLSLNHSGTHNCDILDSLLLAIDKGWDQGISLLMPLATFSFARLSTSEKLIYTLNIFTLLKQGQKSNNQVLRMICEYVQW